MTNNNTPKMPSLRLGSKNGRISGIIPIDRPRPTTPVSVASLESFIKLVPKSENAAGERIKLTLPGEQFSGSERIKSQRKVNPQVYLEFCKKGLRSASKSIRKKDDVEYLFPKNDLFDGQDASLAPISPICDFEDNWAPFSSALENDIGEGQLSSAAIARSDVDGVVSSGGGKECDKCDCCLKKREDADCCSCGSKL